MSPTRHKNQIHVTYQKFVTYNATNQRIKELASYVTGKNVIGLQMYTKSRMKRPITIPKRINTKRWTQGSSKREAFIFEVLKTARAYATEKRTLVAGEEGVVGLWSGWRCLIQDKETQDSNKWREREEGKKKKTRLKAWSISCSKKK